ncbi:MAG TPA: PadR family transcriptional regulator [Anaerolineaceae bacterium]|nr:PadR family transcriptional regulator [Anaerolineaceae bacterium]
MKTQNQNEQLDNLSQELRRGALPLAVLCMLQENKYGYALIGDLTAAGVEMDQGTLYPMLRRLESQGLLQSSWVVDGARPRRYYVISPQGREVLASLSGEWQKLSRVVQSLLEQIEK